MCHSILFWFLNQERSLCFDSLYIYEVWICSSPGLATQRGFGYCENANGWVLGRHAEIFLLVQMNSHLISPLKRKKKEKKEIYIILWYEKVYVHLNTSYSRWSEERDGVHRGRERKRLINCFHLCDVHNGESVSRVCFIQFQAFIIAGEKNVWWQWIPWLHSMIYITNNNGNTMWILFAGWMLFSWADFLLL